MQSLEPLPIKCTSADCSNNLHCFRSTKKMVKANQRGMCRYCGADLIDWPRVRGRSLDDVTYTLAALRVEFIRHHFWHVVIDEKALNHAKRKGIRGLQAASEHRMRKYIAPAEPPFDGRQTPWKGNVIYYAQHATASCCRKCIEEWHGIEMGRELNDLEVGYLSQLVMRYVEQRVPDLTQAGESVPAMPRSSDAA